MIRLKRNWIRKKTATFIYRSRFSTNICLIHSTDFTKFQMDKDNNDSLVLLDHQKAFDTVNYIGSYMFY